MIKEEVLKYSGEWWQITHQIYEVNETEHEYYKRQQYLYDKLMLKYNLFKFEVDWVEFEQLPEESLIDYAIRFVQEYACELDIYDFIPDYYQVVFDFNKQPLIIPNSEELTFDRNGNYLFFED